MPLLNPSIFVHSHRRALLPALLVVVLVVLLVLPAGAFAGRDVPVGMANTNDQNLSNSHWLYSIRFVLDRDTTMYRFFSQMKAKGASWDEHGVNCTGPGAGCYGAGDGGVINARSGEGQGGWDARPLECVGAGDGQSADALFRDQVGLRGLCDQLCFGISTWAGCSSRRTRLTRWSIAMCMPTLAHNFSSTNSPDRQGVGGGPERAQQPRSQRAGGDRGARPA